MKGPQISIVMPVRNAAATLPRALASMTAQSHEDWEAVVVDDGSSDGTRELLTDWLARDARVRVIWPERRPGLVGALNLGLAAARAPLIARMDADDVMHPERLARQVARLVDDPALGLVSCGVAFGGDAEAQAGYAAHVDWLNGVVTSEEIRLNRFVESPLAHPSVMFRRELVSRHGGYADGPWPEDYELWLRWLDAEVRMAKVPEVLLTWQDSPERASRVDVRYDVEAFFAVKARWIARELGRSGAGRAVWVAGAGRPTRKRAMRLEEHGVAVAGFVDVDPRKIGGSIEGRPVVGPEELPPAREVVVLSYVANRGGRDKVRAMLEGQGRAEGRDFWLCA